MMKFLCVCLFSVLHVVLYAGDLGPSGQPINLRNADSLTVSTRDSQSVRELSGHVHLDQGNVSVYCDHAIQYMATDLIVLTGNVRIIQGSVTMTMPRGVYEGSTNKARGDGGVTIVDRKMVLKADQGTYDMNTNQADFMGAVSVEDDSIRIDARTIRYVRATQQSWAWDNVKLTSKISRTIVVGDSARNVPATSYAVMKGHPLFVHIDTTMKSGADSVLMTVPTQQPSIDSSRQRAMKKKGTNTTQPSKPAAKVKSSSSASGGVTKPNSSTATSATMDSVNAVRRRLDSTARATRAAALRFDTLTIQADVLESFRAGGEDRFVANRHAEIIRGSMSATAGRCVYDRMQESIDLQMQPRVWADSLQLSADSIWVHLPQRRLRSIRAYYDAFMLLRDSTSVDRAQQISGETIMVDIERDTIRAVRSVKNAKSLYFMTGDQGPDGASRTVCDSLFISFEKGQLDNIVWRSGVSSEYYPENLVGGGTSKYYLPTYREGGGKPRKPDLTSRLEALIDTGKPGTP